MYAYEQEEIMNQPDDFSVSESIPSNLLKNKQPRATNQNRFYSINRTVWINEKQCKKVTINMYGTGEYGSYIKNAVTGASTNHRVGSKAESLYFSVANCTGIDKLRGPIHLYYNSPSEYEKHQFTSVDQATKDEWFNRYNSLKDKYM
jgi:hypothetical protein